MATRTTPGEGDYNLSHPLNSFVDVARRVVLQPVRFFAGLPRDRNFVSPLLFALICIEISTILGWLLVISGVGSSPGFNPNPQNAGLPSVVAPGSPVASILLAPIGGAVGIFLVSLIQQLLVRLIVGARNSGFQATFRVASYTQVTSLVNQPGELDTVHRSSAGSVRHLPVHRWYKGDAPDNDGQGRAGRTDTVRCGPLAGIARPTCGRGGIFQPKVAEGGF
jgi:hypothetical protein